MDVVRMFVCPNILWTVVSAAPWLRAYLLLLHLCITIKKTADGDHPHQQPYMKQARQYPLFFKFVLQTNIFIAVCNVP